MQKSRLLLVTAFALIAASFVVEHLVNRLELGHAVPIRINDFPSTFGDWQSVRQVPIEESFQEVLPTAQVREQIYQNSRGQQVDFLLLTATDYGDLHDPAACFPSQGWDLSNYKVVQIGREHVDSMDASYLDQNVHVLYWRPDYYVFAPPAEALPRAIYKFYSKHFRHDIGESVLVRIVAENAPSDRAAEESFAAAVQAPLMTLRYQTVAR
jgi:hypothetical protein